MEELTRKLREHIMEHLSNDDDFIWSILLTGFEGLDDKDFEWLTEFAEENGIPVNIRVTAE